MQNTRTRLKLPIVVAAAATLAACHLSSGEAQTAKDVGVVLVDEACALDRARSNPSAGWDTVLCDVVDPASGHPVMQQRVRVPHAMWRVAATTSAPRDDAGALP